MTEPLRVYLEFEGSADPITGTVTAGQERQAFTGWLGLIAGLENAIGARQPGGTDVDGSEVADGEVA